MGVARNWPCGVWPSQRLDWEVYRIEKLTAAKQAENCLDLWPNYSWMAVYAALRTMATEQWRYRSVPVDRKLLHFNSETIFNVTVM